MPASPIDPTLHAQIAANSRWANEDPHENAVRGQSGLVAKFEREAREKDPGITDAEAVRRGQCAYKAHMQRLAFASKKARARKKAQ